MKAKRVLVINGPNINMLGIREPGIYGTGTYAQLCLFIKEKASALGIEAEIFQSNCEGELVTAVQRAHGNFDGIVINPAAYTHTSIAIPDAVRAVGLPCVEVHLTDINAREEYRRISYIKDACVATICGRGFSGYADALTLLAGTEL